MHFVFRLKPDILDLEAVLPHRTVATRKRFGVFIPKANSKFQLSIEYFVFSGGRLVLTKST